MVSSNTQRALKRHPSSWNEGNDYSMDMDSEAVNPTVEPTTQDSDVTLPKRGFSISAVRDVVFIAAIYLYFSGFVYRNLFTHALAIPFVSDVPTYTYIIYSYNVLKDHQGLIVIALMVLFCYDTLVRVFEKQLGQTWYGTWIVKTEIAVFSLIAIALFPLLFMFAQDAAIRDVRSLRLSAMTDARNLRLGEGFPTFIHFKSKAENFYDKDLLNEKSYVISQTNDSYYVLDQPHKPAPYRDSAGKAYLSSAYVVAIPKTDVEHITIILPNDRVQ